MRNKVSRARSRSRSDVNAPESSKTPITHECFTIVQNFIQITMKPSLLAEALFLVFADGNTRKRASASRENEAGNFSVNSSEKQLNIASTFFLKMQMEVDKPIRLLQLVAFVHLPFSFRSLDLFVASLLFRKGTSFCVIRRK